MLGSLPRALPAAPAAGRALGYHLTPPLGLNKEEAASCRFTNVQSQLCGRISFTIGFLVGTDRWAVRSSTRPVVALLSKYPNFTPLALPEVPPAAGLCKCDPISCSPFLRISLGVLQERGDVRVKA